MAHQWVRVNLGAAQFPFESDLWGRSIILPGYDINYDRISQAGDKQPDRGLPQAYYMHNVVPTTQGYQAVAYDTFLKGIANATDFDQAFQLEYTSPLVSKMLFSPAGGKNYVYDPAVTVWQSVAVLGNAGASPAGPPTQTYSATAATYVDESFQLPNSTTIASLGAFLTTGNSVAIQLFIVLQNSPGNYTVVANVSGTHTGGDWQDFAVTYAVPASGKYFIACYLPVSAVFNYNTNLTSASVNGVAAGTQTWTETTSGNTPPVRGTTNVSTMTVPQNSIVTTAFVNGITYICYQGIGVYRYDYTKTKLQYVALNGLNPTQVKGICNANGYMIAWTDTTVVWSSTTNPEDFVPSLTTGAGGGALQFAKGKVQFCLPISGGFFAYCEQNVVSATYSSNIRYPYVFAEVADSGGCISPEQVSWQGNNSSHYAWTTSGLQNISRTKADQVFPDATDWLSGLTMEDYDEVNMVLNLTYLSSPLNIKVNVIANRYAIISYGVTAPEFTHALVYDISLKRWGKFKITHRDVFEWEAPAPYGALNYGQLSAVAYGQLSNTTYGNLATTGVNGEEYPRKNIAFLQKDGTVKVVNFDLSQASASGVLIVGKFQFSRDKYVTHQLTDVENVIYGNNFNFYVVPSLNGKDLMTPIPGTILDIGQEIRRYGCRATGLNISLLFMGSFNLTTVIFDFTVAGDR